MAIERWWKAIPAQSLTQNGNTGGDVYIADACLFYVKQQVVLSAVGQPDLTCEVKRICGPTRLMVGEKGKGIKNNIDISAYTIAGSATIRAAEQGRPPIKPQDIDRATYEEEPTMARRVFNVDRCGNPYTKDNPFPVDAEINVDNVEINIDLPDSEGLTVLNIPNKTTEVSFTFPNKTQFYKIKARDAKDVIKVGLNAGDIAAGNYWTIDFGNEDDPRVHKDFPDGYTLYFESKHKNDVDLEIRYWYFS